MSIGGLAVVPILEVIADAVMWDTWKWEESVLWLYVLGLWRCAFVQSSGWPFCWN